MIASTIILIIFGFLVTVTTPIRFLDDVSLPSDIAASIATASGWLGSFSFALPIGTILTVFFLVLATEGLIFAYKIVRWIYNKIPGVN